MKKSTPSVRIQLAIRKATDAFVKDVEGVLSREFSRLARAHFQEFFASLLYSSLDEVVEGTTNPSKKSTPKGTSGKPVVSGVIEKMASGKYRMTVGSKTWTTSRKRDLIRRAKDLGVTLTDVDD
jgi:hypothetical protein